MISSNFQNGGSYLLSEENYDFYIAGKENIGRPDGQFITPSTSMDEMLEQHPNDPRAWEEQLGLKEGSLGDNNIYRVDINDPSAYNIREPEADMSGSNEFFTGTGKTIGGMDEAVIDPFPNPETNEEVGSISVLNPENTEELGSSKSEETKLTEDVTQNSNEGNQLTPEPVPSNTSAEPVNDLDDPNNNPAGNISAQQITPTEQPNDLDDFQNTQPDDKDASLTENVEETALKEADPVDLDLPSGADKAENNESDQSLTAPSQSEDKDQPNDLDDSKNLNTGYPSGSQNTDVQNLEPSEEAKNDLDTQQPENTGNPAATNETGQPNDLDTQSESQPEQGSAPDASKKTDLGNENDNTNEL